MCQLGWLTLACAGAWVGAWLALPLTPAFTAIMGLGVLLLGLHVLNWLIWSVGRPARHRNFSTEAYRVPSDAIN